MMKSSDKTAKLPTKAGLMVRLLVVAYLAYIIYSMKDVGTKYSGAELGFYIAVLVVFAVCGLLLAVLSVRDLLQGRYAGGALDTETDTEVLEEHNIHSDL